MWWISLQLRLREINISFFDNLLDMDHGSRVLVDLEDLLKKEGLK